MSFNHKISAPISANIARNPDALKTTIDGWLDFICRVLRYFSKSLAGGPQFPTTIQNGLECVIGYLGTVSLWQSHISNEVYLDLIPHAKDVTHPGM
jgi:hypothetical protein